MQLRNRGISHGAGGVLCTVLSVLLINCFAYGEALDISRQSPRSALNLTGPTDLVPAGAVAAVRSLTAGTEHTASALVSGTYLGGSASEQALMRPPVVLGADGSVYVGGWTKSADFPPTTNPQSPHSYVGMAAFVAKLSADLDSLLAWTVVDGNGDDDISGLAVSPSGTVYAVGNTESDNLPATIGAFDQTFNGAGPGRDPYGIGDVFVLKLSPDLGPISVCTYLGGWSAEHSHNLTLGVDGSVVICGSTASDDFPHGTTAYDTTVNPNGQFGLDVFVVVLDSNLQTLLAGTFIGGSGDDFSEAVVAAPNGDIYVGAWGSSANYPALAGAQMAYGGGMYDGYVSKLNSSLTTLSASTFLGGNYWDMILSLYLDSDGELYSTGHTASKDSFPVTSGCYDSTYNGALSQGSTDDCFVTKLSADLDSITASTYLGGTAWDIGNTIACDPLGRVIVALTTSSGDFPLTPWSTDSLCKFGVYDLAAAVLSHDLTTLYFTTYLGGHSQELYPGLAIGADGSPYLSTPTASDDMPTVNGYDQELSGTWDIHVARLTAAAYTDSDADELADLSDNCPVTPNPEQDDADADNRGDACDSCTDTDNDGFGNAGYINNTCAIDNCPNVANPTQADANSDGIGDACCCVGVTGNVNYAGIVDLADLSALVSYLTGGGYALPCPKEANVNRSGIVDLGDLSALVSYLTGGGYTLPVCE